MSRHGRWQVRNNLPLIKAGWSSLVARWVHIPKVVGSNPTLRN